MSRSPTARSTTCRPATMSGSASPTPARGIAPEHTRPGVRALLHHQAGRQGHRPRPHPDLRLRAPVRRPRHHRVRRSARARRVSLYLPRFVGADERRRSARPAGRSRRSSRRPTHPGAPILVVEDDPRVSRSTVGALEELGYRPLACGGGREALELLAEHAEVDLVDHRRDDAGNDRHRARRGDAPAPSRTSRSCSSPAMSARRARPTS